MAARASGAEPLHATGDAAHPDWPLELRLLQLHQPHAPSRVGLWLRTALAALCWGQLAGVVLVWLLVRWAGDRWWPATLLMFAPRWAAGVPLFLLVPLAVLTQRRLLLPLGLAAGVVVCGLMGLCWSWPAGAAAEAQDLRVLVCNLDAGASGQAALRNLLARVQPDVVALQDCGDWDADAIRSVFPEHWHVQQVGEYAVVSSHRILRSETLRRAHPPAPDQPLIALYCLLDTPAGPVGFCTVHLRTPRDGLNQVLDRRTLLAPSRSAALKAEIEMRGVESAQLARWLAGRREPLVIAGDFNLPVDSAIYRRDWSGYRNAFSEAGLGFGATKVTQVHGIRYGLRIDHVLADPSWRVRRAWVAHGVGSDHLPLVAEVGR